MFTRLSRKLVANRRLNTLFFVAIFFLITSISIGYAALNQNLMITGDVNYFYHSKQLYDVLLLEARRGTLSEQYTGQHQDSVSGVGTHDIFHWYAENDTEGTAILDKNNVIFAGQCWQIIRTTDTGGVKMIYNGEAENNKCLNTRGNHIGYKHFEDQNLASSYYYGDSYTYNSSTGLFSLDGHTEAVTWNASSGPTMVGRYTCKETSASATCSTLYLVESYLDSTTARLMLIDDESPYSQFGIGKYSVDFHSMADAGYMYNPDKSISRINEAPTSGSLFGTGVSYANGVYTLTNTSTTYDTTHHYTCNNTTGTCSTVRYYFHANNYLEISDSRNIEQVVNDMLYASDVNQKNSMIKTSVDAWYAKYLTGYDDYIEDTIYCNDRSIIDLGGFDPNGGAVDSFVQFKEYSLTTDLSCSLATDQFSTLNSSAQLKYKVGLMSSSEMNLLNNNIVRSTGEWYWLLSPYQYSSGGSSNFYKVVDTGEIKRVGAGGYNEWFALGVRPAISLVSGTEYVSGTGTMEDPYIVDAVEGDKQYVLTYDSNGGNSCPSKYVVKVDGSEWGTLCTPTREGYTFTGWNTRADGSGTTITSSTIANYNLKVFAQWESGFTITYELDGGSAENPDFYTTDTATFTLNNPTKTNYIFAGWTGSNDIEASLSLYTTSNPYHCTVRNCQVGSDFEVVPGTIYRIFVDAKRITGTIDMQGGMWYTEQTSGSAWDGYRGLFTKIKDLEGGWARYYKDITVPAGKTRGKMYIQLNQPSSNLTLSWDLANMHIIVKNAAVTIPIGSVGDKNYNANWFDTLAPTISNVSASSTLDLSNYIEFTATDNLGIVGYNITTSTTEPTTWIPVADIVENTTETKYEYNAAWARIFHHNNHWGSIFFSNINDAKSYNTIDRYSVLNQITNYALSNGTIHYWELLLQYPDKSQTEYNRWTQNANPVTSTIANGDGSASADGYSGSHIDWSGNYWGGLTASSNSGVLMDGSTGHSNTWYSIGATSAYQGGTPGPNSTKVSTVNLWSRIDNGLEGSAATLTRRIGDIRTNGTYYVWVKDTVGNTAHSSSVTVSNVDTTSPTISSISLSSGTTISATIGDNKAIDKYYIGTTNPASSNVTYTSVSGTVTSQSISATINATGPYYISVVDKAGNRTISNKDLTNTVSFNVNGGGGSGYQTADVTASYGSAMPTISTTKPTKTGYTFGGWYDTSAATGGTQYYTAAGASARAWNKTTNTTLYARWTPVTNTVSFNVNGGGGSGYQTASVTATYGSAMPTISTTKPTKSGYTFGGWYDTSAASGGTRYYTAAGASARTWNKTANTTLYARWTPTTPVSFSNDSWDTIIANVKAGNTSAYAVGSTKSVSLSGIGTFTLRVANTTTPSACSGSSYSQTACGFVLEFADIITTHVMNSSMTNVGGWPASEMRTYVNSTIYNALPSTLKNSIINTRVVSGHGSTSGEGNFTSTDKIYLLSSVEVYGSNYEYDTLTTSQTRQLDYYVNKSVTSSSYSGAIKKNSGTAAYWWLRSGHSSGKISFNDVNNNGMRLGITATNSIGVSPAFRIG